MLSLIEARRKEWEEGEGSEEEHRAETLRLEQALADAVKNMTQGRVARLRKQVVANGKDITVFQDEVRRLQRLSREGNRVVD